MGVSKINISEHNEIIRLYCEEKTSTTNISKLFSVCPTTIGNILRKNNILVRTPSETMSFHSELLTGRPPTLSFEQELKAIHLYCEEKLSAEKIGKLLSISRGVIENTLHKHNIIVRTAGETNKLSTKFTFYDMNKEKAFVLGVIFGDGSISKRQDYINVTSGDLDILEKVRKVFGSKFRINKVKDSNCYRGIINSHKLCEEILAIFGIKNNKSDKLIFPKLEDDIMPAFISGYLATDGCIMLRNNSKTQCKSLGINFYSCSKKYLLDLRQFIYNKLGIMCLFYERKNIKDHLGKKPLFILIFNGKKAEQLAKYLFDNTSEYLQCIRKTNIYKNYMLIKHNIIL